MSRPASMDAFMETQMKATHGFPRTRQRACTLGLLAAAFAPHALAQDESPPTTAAELPEVRVTATRIDSDIDSIAGTVTVIDSEHIQRNQAHDLESLFRYEPGVSVRVAPYRPGAALGTTGRAGNEGINIRGMEGNRVLLQTDGVRLPASFTHGAQFSGRGDYLDVEGYRTVDVMRGPASTLYGSDGLGGAVSFRTKDVDDLLTLGKSQEFGLKAGYASVNDGWLLSPSFAARGERFEGMVLGAFRSYGEPGNMGGNSARDASRDKPNPQDNDSSYLLAKLGWQADARHRFGLTYERLRRDIDGDVYSGRTATVSDLGTRDRVERDLLRLNWRFDDASHRWVQNARVSVHYQDSSNRQFSDERRPTLGDRTRDAWYEERLLGLSAQFESRIGDRHRLSYGIDIDQMEITNLRNGTPAAGTFPEKAFPDTDYRIIGAFVQDEITAGSLLIIPGLRVDHFVLDPKRNDPLYKGLSPEKLSDTELSPKLGLIWQAHPALMPYAQYAHGFRAPTPYDVNNGFVNLSSPFFAYQTISNPDLKPETSRSVEIGLRGRVQGLAYALSLYRNIYRDFIENATVGGTGIPSDPLIYQYVNRSRARIHGFELSTEWAIDRHWTLAASYARSQGKSRQDDDWVALETIDPARAVIGLQYAEPGRYALEAVLTAVERKKRAHDDTAYRPSGFAVLDLTGHYQLNRHARIDVGLFNVFDRKYFHWADTRSLSSTSSVIDAYSQPGRNFAASFSYRF